MDTFLDQKVKNQKLKTFPREKSFKVKSQNR